MNFYLRGEYPRLSHLITSLSNHAEFISGLEQLPFIKEDFSDMNPHCMFQRNCLVSFKAKVKLPKFDSSEFRAYEKRAMNGFLDLEDAFNIDLGKDGYWKINYNNLYSNLFQNITSLDTNDVSCLSFIAQLQHDAENRIFFFFDKEFGAFDRIRKQRERSMDVYLMTCRKTGISKIGISRDVENRLKTLRQFCKELEFIYSWKGNFKDEKNVLQIFKQFNTTGEWFFLPEDAQTQIDNYFNQKYNESEAA
jgi:hypothetical protein